MTGSNATPEAANCDVHAANPSNWSAAELGQFNHTFDEGATVQPVTGTASKAMIVGTGGPLAIRAGRKVLENCGNALDAVLTTSFAEIALAAGSWTTFAGRGQILYYQAATNKVTVIDGDWNTIIEELHPETIPEACAKPTGRCVFTHGLMAAAGVAHEQFGRQPWATLFEPAIWVAENGFIVNDAWEGVFGPRAPFVLRTPEGRDIFLKANGEPYLPGDVFKQPKMAYTLHQLADVGYKYFYEGPWAEKWVQLVQREGGVATMKDLTNYQALVQDPLSRVVRGHNVLGAPLSYPVVGRVFDALSAVEAADMRSGPTPYEDGAALYKEWSIWHATPAGQPGHHSEGVVAVDKEGNVATILHTINTLDWGGTGIFVDGISLTDAASLYTSEAQAAGPGNRIPSDMNPMMVTEPDGKPSFVLSSVGTSLNEINFQRLVDVLEYNEPFISAIFNGTFHEYDTAQFGLYDEVVLTHFREMGGRLVELPMDAMALQGYIVGIQIDPLTGQLGGAFGTNTLTGRVEGIDN